MTLCPRSCVPAFSVYDVPAEESCPIQVVVATAAGDRGPPHPRVRTCLGPPIVIEAANWPRNTKANCTLRFPHLDSQYGLFIHVRANFMATFYIIRLEGCRGRPTEVTPILGVEDEGDLVWAETILMMDG